MECKGQDVRLQHLPGVGHQRVDQRKPVRMVTQGHSRPKADQQEYCNLYPTVDQSKFGWKKKKKQEKKSKTVMTFQKVIMQMCAKQMQMVIYSFSVKCLRSEKMNPSVCQGTPCVTRLCVYNCLSKLENETTSN